MVLIDLHKKYRQTLKKSYSVAEIDDLFKRLINGFFDWEPTLLGLEPQKQLAPQVIAQLEEALDRLAKHEPVQYIIGKAHFRDLLLDVDSSTLIPRPETEELVEWVISDYPPDAQLHIVDVGTGSGCIALALQQHFEQACIRGVDKSVAALSVAQKNALNLQLPVLFSQQSIESLPQPAQAFDAIVSNPPYVRTDEVLAPNVLDYEPHMALFTPPKQPLYYYEHLAEYGQMALKSGGHLYFEINPLELDLLKQMLLKKGFTPVEVRTDIFGKFRFLRATQP